MMHESQFTFAVEKLGRIALPGPALSLAIMMLCGQNQQLPLPGTAEPETHPVPPWEISATRRTAGQGEGRGSENSSQRQRCH